MGIFLINFHNTTFIINNTVRQNRGISFFLKIRRLLLEYGSAIRTGNNKKANNKGVT
ncbi:MAG: hypothetical protein AB8B59_05940 [Maribacter sp.]